MAFLSPVWASEMTSVTTPSPRVFNEQRRLVQNASVSLSPTSKPRTSRPASGGHPDQDDHGLGDDAVIDRPCNTWHRGTRTIAGRAEVPFAERGYFAV